MYDSALLDDLHNYFPELLYAPERFRSVPDVLAYVQEETRRRFDLFSRGRREFIERDRAAQNRRAEVSLLFETNRIPVTAAPTSELLNAINLMSGLFHGPTIPVQNTMVFPGQTGSGASFLDPVTVRPTAAQIASGTAIEIVDTEDEICSICQDHLPPGSQALGLVACDHRFHSECITTWFTSHVQCPVCRHDIREPIASPEPNPAAGAP
jgi:hypothetical protein